MHKGRVIEAHRTNYTVALETETVLATVRGNFHVDGDFPKVGDYVEVEMVGVGQAVIETVLPRVNVIKRRIADGEEEQIIVTNVEVMFIVMGLDGDFNLSRLERYLLLAKQSDVKPVIVLNKADVVDDVKEYVEAVGAIAGDCPLYTVVAKTGDGLEAVARHITPNTTAVLLGSSGAGKSTITNWLLQENKQQTKDIRQDDSKGRHTTTSRQLFTLPSGGFLIDTPGMRELGMHEVKAEEEKSVFERVDAFARECQFNDCDHEKSAGCAVLAAVESGDLTAREVMNYRKLLQERLVSGRKDSTAAARHNNQHQRRLLQKSALKAKKLRNG